MDDKQIADIFMEMNLNNDELEKMLEGRPKREIDILRSAIHLFSERGFVSTTTKEIAQGAGIAEGTIFRYFKTKKDILLSLVSAAFIRAASPHVLKGARRILEQKDKDTRTILKELILDRFDLIQKIFPVISIIFTELQYHQEIRDIFIEEIPKQGLSFLLDFIKERVAQGEFRQDIDPLTMAKALVGMIAVHIASPMLIFPEQKNLIKDEKTIDAMIDIFIQGVKK